ncbi:MAG TPA: MFS transporter [Alphaproteobacteria bacterium]|nr:MFS transporter [Alphaproteobacteria bacterium]
MSSAHGLRAITRALAQPNFGIYVAGNAVSLVGTWMQRIAVGWLTWQLTGSGAWLGIVAFADLFPSIFVGPFGGAVADRRNPLRVVAAAQSCAMVIAALLFVLTATGAIGPYVLAGVVFMNGVVIGFNQPSRLALVPSLVRTEDLSTAVAINSIIFNLARFVGPAVAGVLIATFGVASAFAVNAATFLVFLLALTRVRLPAEPAGPARLPGGSVLDDIGEGVRYTVAHPGIGPLLLLLTVTAIAIRPFIELLPGFAADVFGRGATGLAILSSTIGVGAVAGGLWLAQRGRAEGLTAVALGSTLALALSTIAFVATTSFWFAVAALAFAGVVLVVSGVASQTLLQLAVPKAMRGRVLSLFGIIFRGGPAVGALVMGALSEWVGLRLPLFAGALLTAALWAWLWPRRARIAESLENPATE